MAVFEMPKSTNAKFLNSDFVMKKSVYKNGQ